MTTQYWDGEPDEDQLISAEHKAELVEDALFLGIVNRTEIDLAWLATTAEECAQNVERFTYAAAENIGAGWVLMGTEP